MSSQAFGTPGTRQATIRWFKETQAHQIYDPVNTSGNFIAEWFHGVISRRYSFFNYMYLSFELLVKNTKFHVHVCVLASIKIVLTHNDETKMRFCNSSFYVALSELSCGMYLLWVGYDILNYLKNHRNFQIFIPDKNDCHTFEHVYNLLFDFFFQRIWIIIKEKTKWLLLNKSQWEQIWLHFVFQVIINKCMKY